MQETYSLYNYYFDQYLPGDDHYFWIKCMPLKPNEERPYLYASKVVTGNPNLPNKQYDYSLDLQTWNTLPYRERVYFEDVIYLRNHYTSNALPTNTYNATPITFKVSKLYSIGGNMDLLVFKNDVPLSEANLPNTNIYYERDPSGPSETWGPFAQLFRSDANLVSAKCVKFHEGTVMKRGMFAYTFAECTNLRNCFKLPPGDLSEGSCVWMFYHCYKLKEIPQLPEHVYSTTVTDVYGDRLNPCSAIAWMFGDCRSFEFSSTKKDESFKEYIFPSVTGYWDSQWDSEPILWWNLQISSSSDYSPNLRGTTPIIGYTNAKIHK